MEQFTKFFAQNFELLGLKKLISTSFAPESKKFKEGYMPTLFETESPIFDQDKTRTHGKIFVLDHDANNSGRIDIEDLQWQYLEGDGDFRSKEIRKLRDEADIIVTNPPFSLFREFITWIMEAEKLFIIIGNMNAITYKEVFPLIRDDKVWLGNGFDKGNAFFRIINGRDFSNGVYDAETGLVKFRNCCWFTNIDHGRRHQPLKLMTMADNFKHSKHKEIRGRKEYIRYENFDAIEIPYTDAIPDDFLGIMGVPSSFLDKYCPEQFEIIGIAEGNSGRELGLKPYPRELKKLNPSLRDGQLYYIDDNGIPQKPYARILIRKKQ